MLLDYAIMFAALALGGFVKGATGAGMPILAVPVLASFFDVPFAIAMMTVPTIVTNLWQMARSRGEYQQVAWLKWMWLMAGIGILFGTWLLTALPAEGLSIVLAVVVVLYIVMRLARPHWHIPRAVAGRTAPVAGFAAGALQGATGISAPVSITFLSSIQLSRPQFLLAIATLFVVYAVVQIPALALAGVLTLERGLYSALALIPVTLAMPAGNWVGARLGRAAFDRLILVLLAVIAVKLFIDAGLF